MITKIQELKDLRFLLEDVDDYLLLENSTISPSRFKDSDLSDIIDFIDELLYNNKNIDITEKVAGQHLTVNIKNNFVSVNTKDSILYNTGDKNASKTSYGRDLTNGIMQYLKYNNLPDQSWSFEIVHPDKNHDYIKYKNTDVIYIEYTGNLTKDVADKIRSLISVRLLTKDEIKVNINKNKAFLDFKNEWENFLKSKYQKLDASNKGRYYYNMINDLKYKIGKLLDEILVSVVDKVSPVEGIVVSTKNPIKLQTNNFLAIQRIQMPVYSLFKLEKNERDLVFQNAGEKLENIKNKFGLVMNGIHRNELQRSAYEILKSYLSYNSKLRIDGNKYKQWMTATESDNMLKTLNVGNANQIFNDIYNKMKQ